MASPSRDRVRESAFNNKICRVIDDRQNPTTRNFPKERIAVMPYDGTIPWGPWYLVFEHVMDRLYAADDEQARLVRMQASLTGPALMYFGLLPLSDVNDYQRLVAKMKARFGARQNRKVALNALTLMKQQTEETIEAYAQRALATAMDAYPHCNEESVVQDAAVQAFLRGATDSEAAVAVMDQNPNCLEAALCKLRDAICNRMTVRGGRKHPMIRAADVEEPLLVDEADFAEVRQLTGNRFQGGQRRVSFNSEAKKESPLEQLTAAINKMAAESARASQAITDSITKAIEQTDRKMERLIEESAKQTDRKIERLFSAIQRRDRSRSPSADNYDRRSAANHQEKNEEALSVSTDTQRPK